MDHIHMCMYSACMYTTHSRFIFLYFSAAVYQEFEFECTQKMSYFPPLFFTYLFPLCRYLLCS